MEMAVEDDRTTKIAHNKGWVHAGYGQWKDPHTGKVVARTDNGRLIPVKSKNSFSDWHNQVVKNLSDTDYDPQEMEKYAHDAYSQKYTPDEFSNEYKFGDSDADDPYGDRTPPELIDPDDPNDLGDRGPVRTKPRGMSRGENMDLKKIIQQEMDHAEATLEISPGGQEAKRKGLVHKAYGWYMDPSSGKIVARVKNGELIPVSGNAVPKKGVSPKDLGQKIKSPVQQKPTKQPGPPPKQKPAVNQKKQIEKAKKEQALKLALLWGAADYKHGRKSNQALQARDNFLKYKKSVGI